MGSITTGITLDQNKQASLMWDILTLYVKKIITEEEYNRLDEMITSPDPENMIVAEELIDQIIKGWVKHL